MGGKAIIPKGSPKPIAPYSPAMKAGNVVYVAGIVALDRDGKTVGVGDVAAQTRHVIETIADILKEAGGSLADITFNTIILQDLADYAKMNEAYKAYFAKDPPARYCIGAKLVRDEFLVEIASIAHLSEAKRRSHPLLTSRAGKPGKRAR
jgi:aminoacrylate peracid reductase